MIDCSDYGAGVYSPPFQAQAVINERYGGQFGHKWLLVNILASGIIHVSQKRRACEN